MAFELFVVGHLTNSYYTIHKVKKKKGKRNVTEPQLFSVLILHMNPSLRILLHEGFLGLLLDLIQRGLR